VIAARPFRRDVYGSAKDGANALGYSSVTDKYAFGVMRSCGSTVFDWPRLANGRLVWAAADIHSSRSQYIFGNGREQA
jgi:hypothetical protein